MLCFIYKVFVKLLVKISTVNIVTLPYNMHNLSLFLNKPNYIGIEIHTINIT